MTTQNTQVAQAQQNQKSNSPVLDFSKVLTGANMSKYLTDTLGVKKAEFVANVTTLVSNNALLHDCVPNTIIFSALKATALNLPLDPNLGMAYVIPYKNKNKGIKEAQFQIGYKGFVQLAIRSGQFKTINVRDVREGEYLGEDFISGEMQFKQVADRINKKVIGYLAYFRLINGFEKMSYWTIEEMEKHARQYSQSYSSQYPSTRESSKWTTDFDAMAKKTILKLLLAKYAPLSIEMQTAVKSDQAVIDENGERYVDNEQPAVIATPQQSKKAVDIMTQGFADAEIVEEPTQE